MYVYLIECFHVCFVLGLCVLIQALCSCGPHSDMLLRFLPLLFSYWFITLLVVPCLYIALPPPPSPLSSKSLIFFVNRWRAVYIVWVNVNCTSKLIIYTFVGQFVWDARGCWSCISDPHSHKADSAGRDCHQWESSVHWWYHMPPAMASTPSDTVLIYLHEYFLTVLILLTRNSIPFALPTYNSFLLLWPFDPHLRADNVVYSVYLLKKLWYWHQIFLL